MPVAYLCLCLQVLVIVCRIVSSGDVFASSAQLQMLADGEMDLIDAVKSYINEKRKTMERLEELITAVEDNRVSPGESVMLSRHPIDAIRLIRRFTTTWNNDIFPLISGNATSEGVDKLRQSLEEIIPTEEDYDGAKSSLLRLQHTYLLSVSDLINGTILHETTKPLSQQMALEVSLHAFRRKLNEDALEWLTHAQNHRVPPLVPLQDIYHASGRIHAQKGELLQASKFITKALELDPSNTRFLSEIMPESTDNGESLPTYSGQERLCLEFAIENPSGRRSNAEAFCRLERNRVVPFTYRKVEYLNRSPDVLIFHDFITDSEANKLIHLGKTKIQRALMGNTSVGIRSDYRIAKSAWLLDNSGEPLVDKISRRIEGFTGLDVTANLSAEPLQLGNYGLGGHYGVHYDFDRFRFGKENLTGSMKTKGDRIATLMIYLSDVEAGGATIFPEIDLGTRPIKNAAIFWYNYKRSGLYEPKMLHAGCPVLIGEKWVANKWIREFNQLFKRPCDLEMDV